MSDYAPFPERDLEIVAQYHEEEAAGLWRGTWAGDVHAHAAKTCRDALAAHLALRERFLLAETERRIANASPEAAD